MKKPPQGAVSHFFVANSAPVSNGSLRQQAGLDA
jgi:hypothetical protein